MNRANDKCEQPLANFVAQNLEHLVSRVNFLNRSLEANTLRATLRFVYIEFGCASKFEIQEAERNIRVLSEYLQLQGIQAASEEKSPRQVSFGQIRNDEQHEKESTQVQEAPQVLSENHLAIDHKVKPMRIDIRFNRILKKSRLIKMGKEAGWIALPDRQRCVGRVRNSSRLLNQNKITNI